MKALTQAWLRLILDNSMCQQMGSEARMRALELFFSKKITGELMAWQFVRGCCETRMTKDD